MDYYDLITDIIESYKSNNSNKSKFDADSNISPGNSFPTSFLNEKKKKQ